MERRETVVLGAASARRDQQLRPNQPELWLRTVLPDVRAWLRETRAGGRDALAGAYAFALAADDSRVCVSRGRICADVRRVSAAVVWRCAGAEVFSRVAVRAGAAAAHRIPVRAAGRYAV